MTLPLVRSLTARLLMVVLLGVIVPLVLTGVWLTKASERAGRALLRGQLEAGAALLTQGAAVRMSTREGELQLLANNAAAATIFGDEPVAPETQAYLRQLADALGPAIFAVEYIDSAGRVRWPVSSAETSFNSEVPRVAVEPSVLHERAVMVAGAKRGTVRARIRLATLVPLDSVPMLVAGASLVVRDSSGLVLWRSAELTKYVERGDSTAWETVAGTLQGQRLTFDLMAPSTPFVAPFEAAAKSGLGVLGAVAVLALLVSVVFVRQAASALRALSVAATAVAEGDLTRSVEAAGNDEVAQLAHSFNRMTQSLRDTLLELSRQRSLAAVGEYAATLSHEVRNSLTSVRVELQHAARLLGHEHPARPLVNRALDSVRGLDGTVTSALRMARTGHVVRHRVPLAAILGRACSIAQHQFDERKARLHTADTALALYVNADAAALEQLFVNVLLNAAQALPPGGEARVTLDEGDGQVRVHIADTGTGIDESLRAHLGTPLASTKPTGTGLGLPIARRIAEAHAGRLDIESRAGEGTLVTLTLPLDPATIASN